MKKPSPTEIAKKIQVENGLFNGRASLVDAFLSALPCSLKEPGNDFYIKYLFLGVKDILVNNKVPQPEQPWALLS